MSTKQRTSVPIYAVRLVREGTATYAASTVERTEQAFKIVEPLLVREVTEVILVVYLNGKGRPIGLQEVSRGGLHGCAVTPADVFRGAIVAGASAIIVAHNHPSGDATPSREDVVMTRSVLVAGKVLGVDVLDHIIVARDVSGKSRFETLRDHMTWEVES